MRFFVVFGLLLITFVEIAGSYHFRSEMIQKSYGGVEMIAKTREELEEIMPEGDLTLKQFNIRISNASIKQFNYILGILQLSSIGKVSKQNAIEYIIKKQFDSIMESPKNKGVSIADKVANGEKL